MKPGLVRLVLIFTGVVLGGLTYAGVSYVIAFAGYLGFQKTSARFEIDVPNRFSDVGFANNAFARYSAVFGLAIFAIVGALTFTIEQSFAAALIASLGGAALATAIIFAKPDILRREETNL